MPAPGTITEFVELGCKAGLLEKTRANALCQQGPDSFSTPQQLANILVQQGLLTQFQAQQLLLGRWHGFILSKKYRLLDCIGQGGMGSVYLCEHLRMHRLVAIKILPASQAKDPSNLERFYREARAVAALNHPNIVRAHDIDQDNKLHYLVMEYVEGNSLQKIVKEHGPMEVLRAAHYIAQAAAGLQHAHESGLVHRDIKPANLLLERSGTIKVLDLGLARFFHEGNDQLTHEHDAGAVLGTADYLAPEQAHSPAVDIRADIYSLGATFYFLLAGHAPFHDKNIAQKLVCHQMRQPRPIQLLRRNVPDALANLMNQMMAKRPEDRFQQPKEVAQALSPWTRTPIPPPPDREMPPSYARFTAGGSVAETGPRPSAAERNTLPDIGEAPTAITQPKKEMPSLENTGISPSSVTMITTPPPVPVDQAETSSASLAAAEPDFFAPLSDSSSGNMVISEESVFCSQFTQKASSKRLAKKQEHRRWLWPVAMVAVFGMAVLGGWLVYEWFFKPSDAPPIAKTPPVVPGKAGPAKLNYRPAVSPFGQVLRSIPSPAASVTGVALSPDGEHLIIATNERTPKLWETINGQFPVNLIGHGQGITWVTFSPDGEMALTASRDYSLGCWHLKYGSISQFKRLTGLTQPLYCADFVPPGHQIVSGGADHHLHLWDLKTGKVIRTLKGHTQPVLAVAAAVDGKRALSGSEDGTVRLWDLAAGKELRQWKDSQETVEAVAFSPEGRLAAWSGPEKQIFLWDTDRNKKVQTFKGHTGTITALVFSAPGRYLLSASEDGTVRAWDILTGQEIYRFAEQSRPITTLSLAQDGTTLAYSGPEQAVQVYRTPIFLHGSLAGQRAAISTHKSPVETVAFSPNGKLAASAGNDKVIRLWDVVNLKQLRTIPGHQDIIHRLAFSPDGQQLLSAGKDKTVRRWSVSSGTQLQLYQGHEEAVHQALFAPEGRILSASADGTLRLWEVVKDEVKVVQQFTGHGAPVWNAVWSPDRKQIATVGADKTLRLWDAAGGELQKIDLPSEAKKILFLPNGKALLTDSEQNQAYLWTLKPDGPPTPKALVGHQDRVTALAVSRDGRLALTGSKNGEIILWDMANLRPVHFFAEHKGTVKDLVFSPDVRQAISAGEDGTVRIWDLPPFTANPVPGLLRIFGAHPLEVEQFSLSPDGKMVVTACQDNHLRLWDVATGKEITKLTGHTRPVLSVQFSPDARWLVSGSMDGTARLWKTDTGKQVHLFSGHHTPLYGVAFSADGNFLLTAGADRAAVLWELETGSQMQKLAGHNGTVTGVVFLLDGKQALTASTDEKLRLWDLKTGQTLHVLNGHTGAIRAVAISPDGRLAVSGGTDHAVCLWDLQQGGLLHKFTGHTQPVTSVAFSGDGLRVLSGSMDNSLRLWDVTKRQPLHTLTGHAGAVTGLAFLPGGLHVLSCSHDRTLRLWSLPVPYPAQVLGK